MKTSFKKLVAGASITALVAMNALTSVNAGALNGATAVVTPTTGIVVTGAGFPVGGSCAATITRTNTNGSTSSIVVDSCTQTDATHLTIAASTVAASEYYTITFNTTNGVFGSTTAGDTTNNVLVTATVVPTLSMSLSTPTLALGTLGTAAYATASVDVATATNAVGGADVTVASVGLKDTAIGKEIGVTDIAGGTSNTNATDYYKIQSKAANAGNNNAVLADVNGADIYSAAGTDMLASQVVLNGTTSTDSTATTTVTVGSKIAATTEAGNYSDTLTFTVVGTF